MLLYNRLGKPLPMETLQCGTTIIRADTLPKVILPPGFVDAPALQLETIGAGAGCLLLSNNIHLPLQLMVTVLYLNERE